MARKWHLDADELIPVMPEAIKADYLSKDARFFGWSKDVEKWMRQSPNAIVQRFVRDIREASALQQKRAIARMKRNIDVSSELPVKSGPIRQIMHPIDPVIKRDMEKQDRHAFTDPKALNDTKRQHPKLFIERGK